MNGASLGRLLLWSTFLGGLGSCSLPGIEKSPQFHLTPEFTLYKLSGDARVQTLSSGVPVDNPNVRAADLAQDQRDAGDWGGTLSIGDGFSGLDLSYLHIDFGSTKRGTLPNDFGALEAGDVVWSQLKGDEWRLRYHGETFAHEWKSGLALKAGPGIELANRDLRFKAVEVGDQRQQTIAIHDTITPYLSARARLTYQHFGLDVDYAIDPDLHFGGDYDGVMQDMSVSLRWMFAPDNDMTLIAGYRYFDLIAKGYESGAAYAVDWVMDGYFFAISLSF